MKKFVEGLYIKAVFKATELKNEVLYNENGDTNFISIIIVLGIVLALVVVFRGYITSILGKIKGNVNAFNNNAF